MPVAQPLISSSFFFNDTATPAIYTLSLHDALPIFGAVRCRAPLPGRVGVANDIGPILELARVAVVDRQHRRERLAGLERHDRVDLPAFDEPRDAATRAAQESAAGPDGHLVQRAEHAPVAD